MSRSTSATTWLVGDIGGTNARFGLASPDGTLLHSRVLADADCPDIGEAIEAYLAERGGLPRPRRGALATPPVGGDGADDQSSVGLRSRRCRRGSAQQLAVISDFTAQASRSHLSDDDRSVVGGGAALPAIRSALGPGSARVSD